MITVEREGELIREASVSEQMFKAYDEANPAVWDAFVRFTLELIAAGHKRGSAEMVYNRIRWETAIVTKPEIGLPQLKLNNNHKPHYARKFMKAFPKYGGFFETRERRS